MTDVSRRRLLGTTITSILLAGCATSDGGRTSSDESPQRTTTTTKTNVTTTESTSTTATETTIYDDAKQLSVLNRTADRQTIDVGVKAADGTQILSKTYTLDAYKSISRDDIITDPGTYQYEAVLGDATVTKTWTPETDDEITLDGVRVFVPDPGVIRATIVSAA